MRIRGITKRNTRDFFKGLRPGDYLSFAGLVVAIMALILQGRQLNTATVWVFGIYILLLAITLVWREIAYARKARYAEASTHIHDCAHHLRDALISAQQPVPERNLSERVLRDALIAFSDAFSLITGANCRACIKTLVAINDPAERTTEFAVETLVRSSTSTKSSADEPTPIADNTDFEMLFKCESRYYICNDLTREDGYKNSHWPAEPDKRREFIRKREYKYVATIVWPIRAPATREGRPEVIGYLCIDALTRGIFEPRYDIQLGAVIADTLYPLLRRYRNL